MGKGGPVFDINRRMYDASSMKAYMRCPTYFMNSYLRSLEPKEESAALDYGTRMHSSLAVLYRSGGDVSLALKEWEGFTLVTDKRSRERGELTTREYAKRYPPESWPKIVAIEQDFALEMPNGAMFSGRMDQVVEEQGEIWVRDHKTTSYLSGVWLESFSPDIQMDGYSWACREIFGRCSGVIIDGILVSKTKNDFARIRSPRSPTMLDEFPSQFATVIARMERDILTKSWMKSTGNCYSFYNRACDFVPLCKFGDSVIENRYRLKEVRDGEEGE